jgi:plasmid stabilization system protein ParE
VSVIRWTPEAVDDLGRLYDFIARYNPPAALRAVTALRNAVRQLLVHPRLGPLVPGFEPREVRALVVGDYEMRYELAGEAIHILRFFHTRENR